jgi:hypothetical protein
MIVEILQVFTQIITIQIQQRLPGLLLFEIRLLNVVMLKHGYSLKLIATDLCDATVANISKVIELCI